MCKVYKVCKMFKVYEVYKMFEVYEVYKLFPPAQAPNLLSNLRWDYR